MSHRPRKRFGQNFLHDPHVIRRIVAAIAPAPGQRLVEIGPGRGAITLPLLQACGELDVIELDRDLIEPLRQRCAGKGQLHIHQQDALRFDFTALAGSGRVRVVGNLPYNISTPLLFHLLAQSGAIADMHFMLQKEVVDRMVAAPGGGDYGRLSVMIQYRCEATPLFHIGAGAFRPAPRVESAFVRLVPHETPPVEVGDDAYLEKVVKAAFSQRRKTLRNTLRPLLDEQRIRSAGVDPSARAETLDLAQFAALARQVAD